MKYQLAIFDLDGTLLDTLGDLADSTNYIMRQYGYPERTITEVRSFVGNGIRKLLERSAPNGTSPEEIDRMFEMFKEYYRAHCADKTKPYDGIMELLHALKKKGVKLAVVSNKADYAVKALCEQYFPGYFDEAVGERVGIARKPAPDTVHEVLKNLKIDKSQAVYIGDSEVDVETAKNAEMDCIAVDWGFRDKEVLENAGAEIIVSTPAGLFEHM
jgi:phosphoglycolate phosphatase